MENVPKIVTQRLRAQTVDVDHPDADVLTAFTERLLPDAERSRVLQHLAGCRDCRDVVALALPAEEPVLEVDHPARGGWLTWPHLRWGLVAAGIIIVGSFGVLRYRSNSSGPTVALYNAPHADASSEAKNQPLTQPESTDKVQSENNEPAAPPVAGRTRTMVDSTKESETGKLDGPLRDQVHGVPEAKAYQYRGSQTPHGPKPPMQLQQNTGVTANSDGFQFRTSVAPAAPRLIQQESASQAATTAPAPVPSAAGASMGGPLKQNQNSQLAMQNRSIEPLSSAGAEVARAKPAQPAAAAVPNTQTDNEYDVSAANGRNFTQVATLTPDIPRWSINAAGGLQRSFDQGKTWEDVDVNSRLGAPDTSNLQLAMKSARVKAESAPKDKLDRKQVPAVFRAVAANGADVWAGGSGGYVYHSVDAGAHWIRIQPNWGGIDLTGDIVNLQFFDPQHGRIVTSTAEIWTTADAGETWEKH